MAKVVSFFTHKGGVGKTTLSLNLSLMLITEDEFKKYNKILIIDCDPQMSLTAYIKNDDQAKQNPFDIHLLAEAGNVKNLNDANSFMTMYWGKGIKPYRYFGNNNKHLDVIFGSFEDATLESHLSLELAHNQKQVYFEKMGEKIDFLKTKYDLIIFDLSPSMNSINQMLLLLSSHIVSPTTPDVFCKINFQLIKKNLYDRFDNTELKACLPIFSGFILNKFRPQLGLSKDSQHFMDLFTEECKKFGFQGPLGQLEDLSGLALKINKEEETLISKLAGFGYRNNDPVISNLDSSEIKKMKRVYVQLKDILKAFNLIIN